jgi:hypothetical protein
LPSGSTIPPVTPWHELPLGQVQAPVPLHVPEPLPLPPQLPVAEQLQLSLQEQAPFQVTPSPADAQEAVPVQPKASEPSSERAPWFARYWQLGADAACAEGGTRWLIQLLGSGQSPNFIAAG